MKWRAWDSEYPDEGAVDVEADTREEARRLGAEKLDIPEEYTAVFSSEEDSKP